MRCSQHHAFSSVQVRSRLRVGESSVEVSRRWRRPLCLFQHSLTHSANDVSTDRCQVFGNCI